ncbi:MAG TPA: HypC/HybG/HupF family hydrogenase formation chaperone [Streptosporangiaceae bacterium]|nr:HypC/HybG/HupF family hydrogenase formation chaperone [Streptosporangiaceae bacterium]
MCLGTVGTLTRVWDEGGAPVGEVDTGAAAQQVSLLACPHAEVGASVLVHSGFVLEVLDPGTAREARRLRSLAADRAARDRAARDRAARDRGAGDREGPG